MSGIVALLTLLMYLEFKTNIDFPVGVWIFNGLCILCDLINIIKIDTKLKILK